jgi:hypothetical protein
VGTHADITVFDPAAVEESGDLRATQPDECSGKVPARQRGVCNPEWRTRHEDFSRSSHNEAVGSIRN